MVCAAAALAGSGCGGDDAVAPVGLTPGASAKGGGEGADDPNVAKKTIEVCEAPEIHASATVVSPFGVSVGQDNVEVRGVVVGAGVAPPPSSVCGDNESWVRIKQNDTNDLWLACFNAPGLQLGLAAGDQVELSHQVDLFAFTASTHITLRKAGALVAHVEWTVVEDDAALPDGMTIARGVDELCRLPSHPCKPRSYGATFALNGSLLSLKPGEGGTLGGRRVFLDRYWLETTSSACDGGGANIIVAITPNPSP